MNENILFDLPIEEIIRFLTSLNPNIDWLAIINKSARNEEKALALFRSSLWVDSSIPSDFSPPFSEINSLFSSIYQELIVRGYLPIRFNFSGVKSIVYLLDKPSKNPNSLSLLPTSIEIELFKYFEDSKFYLQANHIPFEIISSVDSIKNKEAIILAIYWQIYPREDIQALISHKLIFSFSTPNINDNFPIEKTYLYWNILRLNEPRD